MSLRTCTRPVGVCGGGGGAGGTEGIASRGTRGVGIGEFGVQLADAGVQAGQRQGCARHDHRA